ncbi:hypothetical protein V9L05_08680 [Bernardetia sp. Wsw4-3y2]|uniref:hypothetical protein n=1 Tax=Bernardetia sp. Wsw4-3y2 TaxID=3127471 RepID=UPI0030D5DD57
MRFVPIQQKTGLGFTWDFSSINLGSGATGVNPNVDYLNLDWGLFDDKKRLEREAEAAKFNKTILTQDEEDRKRLAKAQHDSILQLIAKTKSTGTQFEKDYYLPQYEEQLECYSKNLQGFDLTECITAAYTKHQNLRNKIKRDAGLQHESQYSEIYNEKAAEENKANKKIYIIGGILIGTAVIGTTIYLVNKD